MREFIAYAKANPGKLNYGHGSSGSWVSAALMSEAAGINTVPIAYRGIPPALVDLLGGQIQFAFADVGNAMAQINGGTMRGLAITTAKRAGKAPNVPPIADTIKDYDISAWFALMAPAGIPSDAAKKLNDTLQLVLAKPALREKLAGAGIDMDVQDSAALARTIDAEIKKWAVWVKVAGITPE
jgi:tripartite-type tricarboxylate transporter receptor subunit TctC